MNPMLAANEALAQRFHRDIFQAGNLAVADEILAPDFVMHAPGLPAALAHGPEGMKRLATATRMAFPDLQTTDEDTIAQGDRVVIRWTFRATHQGEFHGIPPTGTQVTFGGIDIFRVAGGKLVELWAEADNLGLLQQLGAIPAAEHSAA